MNKFIWALCLLCVGLVFNACEEEEEVCTGNETADKAVGTWSYNNQILYDSNGEIVDCYNYCNSSNSLCTDLDCISFTVDCDGSYSRTDGETGSWSYDDSDDSFTTINSQGTFYSYVNTLNSTQFVIETDLVVVIDGVQYDVTAVTSMTKN